MIRRSSAAALAALLLAPALASAQDPAPAPAPAPAAAAPKVTVSLSRTTRDGRRRIVLAGDRFSARGTVTPFVEGQRVVVRLTRGSRRVSVRTVALQRVGSTDRGRFTATFKATRTGALAVRATHRASPELASGRSRAARVRSVRAQARPGARGPVVRLLQAHLDRLRFAVPRSGVLDPGTARAVLAYRKVNRMARTSSASESVVRRVLRDRGGYRVRHPEAGRHVEADLSRQVLSLVDGRRVVRTYVTSSGKGSTPTVRGTFRVYRKTPGTNEKGMVDSVYFIRGYAVHGYPSVPTYPASHGCLRVPIPNARGIFNWLQLGDRVFVYRS